MLNKTFAFHSKNPAEILTSVGTLGLFALGDLFVYHDSGNRNDVLTPMQKFAACIQAQSSSQVIAPRDEFNQRGIYVFNNPDGSPSVVMLYNGRRDSTSYVAPLINTAAIHSETVANCATQSLPNFRLAGM